LEREVFDQGPSLDGGLLGETGAHVSIRVGQVATKTPIGCILRRVRRAP
jgi:hypothetical protein